MPRDTTRAITWLIILAVACSQPGPPTIHIVDSAEFETGPEAGEPNLFTTPEGEVLMSWQSRRDSVAALLVAHRSDRGWGEPTTVYASDDMFVNWADFPSVTATADGVWVAHWLEKVASTPYAYHARLARSTDRGHTWGDPITMHSDQSATEHGFVSMVPGPDGTVDMVWLDGRETGGEPRGPMQVWSGTLRPDGEVANELVVDDRVCDCCQTALIRTTSGLVSAYRDRSDDEIRDIAVRIKQDGSWSEPVHVGDDNWYMTACPVNGPSLAALGDTVAIVWFTAPDREGKVQVAFSLDTGRSFGPPVRIDSGEPLGRVDLEFIDEETVFVAWLERVGSDAEVRGVSVRLDGSVGEPATIVATSQARESGFPRLTRTGDDLLIAYRVIAEDRRLIRVLRASVE